MKKVQLFAAALVAVALTACNAPAEEADAATDAETTEVEAMGDEADAETTEVEAPAAEGEADAGAEGEADAGAEGEADAIEGDI